MGKSNTLISVSRVNKAELDVMKGKETYDSIVGDMIQYFKNTGLNPKSRVETQLEHLAKRIEASIKIMRAIERDRTNSEKEPSEKSSSDNEKIHDLNDEITKLKKTISELENQKNAKINESKNKLKKLVSHINESLDGKNFNTAKFTRDYVVSPSYFQKLLERINREYNV